jgi:hypothetical protein
MSESHPPISLDDPMPDAAARPRYLRRVDVRAAVLVAAVFNTILAVAFAFAGWLVIAVAAQRGLLDQVNSVTSDLSSGHPAQVSAVRLCLVWTLIVALWAVTMTIVVGVATLIFNYVLQLLGGVELDLRASAPERVDVEGIVRGLARAARTKVQSWVPRPVPVGGGAATPVNGANSAAAARSAVVSQAADRAVERPHEESLTAR